MKLSDRIRDAMNTKGFALINTRRYTDDHFIKTAHQDRFGPALLSDYGLGRTDPYRFLMLHILRQLNLALPDESINYECMDLRVDKVNESSTNTWHMDGGYIRTITPLKGISTSYLDVGDVSSVETVKDNFGDSFTGSVKEIPFGSTLIFTAERRYIQKVPGTLHKGTSKNRFSRKLIVATFTTRSETLNKKIRKASMKEFRARVKAIRVKKHELLVKQKTM